MVEDIWFFTVLGILIAFVVFFMVFMFWLSKKMPHPLMMKVLSTLHAALFGYESALVELIGPRGYKSHVFPQIVETIKEIRNEDPLISALFETESVMEAMEKWIEVLQLAGVVDDESKIEKKGEDEYEIVLPHCSMCNPIHDIIGDAKGICPMALIIAASGSVSGEQQMPEIEYSTFYPTGTSTLLKFKKE